MKIKYVDGKRLKQGIIAGSRLINLMQTNLNKINVFPVADGDTGYNMASTMNSITCELDNCSHRSIEEVSSVVAESAIMGAQGNSGAILAQFFNGFAEAVSGKIRLNVASFAEAVKHAKNAAFEAMTDPREGTILTVIKDWTSHIEEKRWKTSDFVELFQSSLQVAKQSLADTPKKLKILAKSGVVDAGAQGFVHLLEGISHFIEKGQMSKQIRESFQKLKNTRKVDSVLKYQYCTECMLISDKSNHHMIKKELSAFGDSLIVIHRNNRFKIHIHSNEPEQVFQALSRFGTVDMKKIDDMRTQQERQHEKEPVAIITDSACDLPERYLIENNIFIVPTKLSFGPETFLDKIEITPAAFYEKLVSSKYHPTTSQPAIASYKEIYEKVIRSYEKGISIHLPRIHSGTLSGAERASKLYTDNAITCIDGKNVSVGLGLVVMEAVEAVKAGLFHHQIVEKIKNAVENVYLFATIPTVDYMVRGGRIGKPKWLLAKTLNLKPILTFDKKNGGASLVGKAIGEKAGMHKTLNIIRKHAEPYKKVKFMIAHANAKDKAKWYSVKLQEMFSSEDEIPIVDAAPVLGVHAGPGTAAVAFIGYK
ncbi:DegV family EDD domain-containing protein [bacterium]|nr:DegV family EDD domain-containing protein [candidate division CSSED10-310 bacterium]